MPTVSELLGPFAAPPAPAAAQQEVPAGSTPPPGAPPGPATASLPEEGPVPREKPPGGSRARPIVEWLVILLIALVFATVVRTYVASSYYIPSASMLPTLHCGDRIVVDKLAYHLQSVHRGDIVVFTRPNYPSLPVEDKDLVKRVIGLPGDTISLQAGQVYVNGAPLPEPFLPTEVDNAGCGAPGLPQADLTHDVHDQAPSPWDLSKPYKVPAGDYFVMGDNRPDSEDSRYFGPIAGSTIVGKATLRYWPLTRIHWF